MGVDPRLLPVLEMDANRPRPELPAREARAPAGQFQQRIRDTYYRPGPVPAATKDLQVPVEGGVVTTQRRFIGHVPGSAMFTVLMPDAGYYEFLAGAIPSAYSAQRRSLAPGAAV
jgi:hypothetical protein